MIAGARFCITFVSCPILLHVSAVKRYCLHHYWRFPVSLLDPPPLPHFHPYVSLLMVDWQDFVLLFFVHLI